MDFDALDEIKDELRPQWFLREGINIIFVGRIFPNKRHQDIIKSFYYFKKLRPESRLILIGPFHPGVRGYTNELANLAAELGLKKDVIFTGMIPQKELNRCYEFADLFFSMSEHEGFFVPLIECMYKRVPILAFASSVIPETLGRSGISFYKKEFGLVAEMMLELIENETLRRGVLDAQTRRVSDFSMQKTLPILEQTLEAG
jgi:glycosyltransferase involved in cell wall biosynthesis